MTRWGGGGVRSHGLAWQAVLATAVLGLAASSAPAQESVPDHGPAGFYVGAEFGGMNYGNACDHTALSCDHKDWSRAAFAGYRFDSHFTLELGWRDLGDARAVYPRLTNTIEVIGEAEGFELSVLWRYPFSRTWEAYLRGGAFRWDAKTRSPEFSTSDSGWSPSVGAGLAWKFHPAWHARLQFLYLGDVGGTETGEANVEMLSVGITYTFGSRQSAVAVIGATSELPAPTR